MGALEYAPAINKSLLNKAQQIEIDSLIAVAQEVMNSRDPVFRQPRN